MPVSATIYQNEDAQITASILDAAGNPITGRTVTYGSSDISKATVDSAGSVHGVGIGSATITATCDTKQDTAAIIVRQARDSSYADVIARAAEDGVRLARFRSGRVATADGDGLLTIPNVPGVTWPTATTLVGVADGGGAIHPSVDAVNGLVDTGTFGSRAIMSPFAGDADLDLSQGLFLVFIGAYVQIGAANGLMGLQRASDQHGTFVLQGSFGSPETLQAFCYTDGNSGSSPHLYFWDTQVQLGGTALQMHLYRLPAPQGANNSLNATPWMGSERIGYEGERIIPHGQVSANEFTPFGSGAYRQCFGAIVGGTVGSPIVNGGRLIYGDDLVFLDEPTDNVKDALMRYFIARPSSPGRPNSRIKRYVRGIGDSRPRGNGASNDTTKAIMPQLEALMDPTIYQCANAAIAGDGWANAIIDPSLTQRVGYMYDASRAFDILCVGPLGVNSFNSGMSAAQALADVDTLIARVRVLHPNRRVRIVFCTETTQAGGIPQAASYNAGLISRLASGAIDALARPDLRTELQDATNSTYFTDGLHNTDAGYAVYAQEYRAAILTLPQP